MKIVSIPNDAWTLLVSFILVYDLNVEIDKDEVVIEKLLTYLPTNVRLTKRLTALLDV